MATPPLVIQTEDLDSRAAAWLGERARLVRCASEDEPRFGELLREAEGLAIRTYTRVNEALLACAPKLRVVGRAGVGVDNVDLEACARRGVVVVNTPAANTRAVVELVTALMLDELRPRTGVDRALGVAEWKKTRAGLIAPRQLSDLTLGIIGLGKVGGGLARVGAAMQMRVVYHDLAEIPEERRFGAIPVSMREALGAADILSIHVDGRASNRNLIDAAALALCKPGVMFINTSRGFVVDAGALSGFLRANPSARAVLDVHEPEPFGPEYPLLGLANCRLLPHIGAATASAHLNMSWVVRDIWRVLCGEQPEFPAVSEP